MNKLSYQVWAVMDGVMGLIPHLRFRAFGPDVETPGTHVSALAGFDLYLPSCSSYE